MLDPLGHMFNKEAVLAALLAKKLDKKPLPPGLEHVKSLKVQAVFVCSSCITGRHARRR